MKVSIITVCLNTVETIEDTIRSVLCQDYKNIEHVIVDGGSTDGTLEILNKYKTVINLISEPDNGIYDAMNKGIRIATGNVVGFLNSGDFYADENVITRIAEAIQANNTDCCYGDLEYVAENNPSKTVRRWKSQPYQDGLFKKGWHPPHPTFFAKKSIFDKYGGFDLSYNIGADYELMLRFLKKHAIKSCYIPNVLVRMRTGGKSNKNLWQIIKANIECLQAWRKNDLKITPFIMLKKPASKLIQYVKKSKSDRAMIIRIALFLTNIILINVSFLLAFLVRYRLDVPEYSFAPYKKSFVFLTVIYISASSFFRVYRSRFKSSWDLFKRVFSGLFLGTLLSVAFVYVFRVKWGAFPTSVFILSFFINLLLIFKLNQFVLKAKKKIKKQVIILGEGKVDDIVGKKANVERKRVNQIRELLEYPNVDEIVVSEKITNAKDLNLLLYLGQKLKAEILFSPSVYLELLPERINGNSSVELLNTFVGRQSDLDEFLMRMLDIAASIGMLLVLWPVMLLISLLIKLTSAGPVLYTQQRVGKDGKTFTLYKFRTMMVDAQKLSGLAPTKELDPRVTKVGRLLRRLRLDELPQLFNILQGKMSLVGPRPENLYRVGKHKALQGLRLAVKPGLTGLAQVRSFYDLKPDHKIKYDYLYIQKRSLLLNLYIIVKTIPVVFSKKGQ